MVLQQRILFFQAVKKRLGDQLINNVPDQEYDGNWGYTGIIGTDIGSRTSDSTNIYDSGWWHMPIKVSITK